MNESILDFVPAGVTLRKNQPEMLLHIEKHWDDVEVFVIDMPTGSGKSLIGGIIGLWQAAANKRTAIITPNIQQQKQIKETFPKFPSLMGKARYTCMISPQLTCERTFELNSCNGYCPGCPYTSSRNHALVADVGIYNYYSFYSLRDNDTDIVIVDEGHNLVNMIVTLNKITFSAQRDGIPNGLGPRGDFLMWIEDCRDHWAAVDREKMSKVALLQLDKRMRKLNSFLDTNYLYHLQIEVDSQGNEKIVAVPRSGVGMSSLPWGRSQKIIIMSATFNEKDLKKLSLAKRRWDIISTDSPIPVDRRPVTYYPAVENTYANKKDKLDIVLEAAVRKIFDFYPDVKGIVHIPYGDQKKYKKAFKGPRFKFHSKVTKQSVYDKFRASDKPQVLFASGMSEGIDLPYDAARFQIIPKIMWANISDSYIKDIAFKDPSWYTWMTMRTTLQQVGRICRAPDDWGATFILDSTFSRLLYAKGEIKLPKYFTNSLTSSAKELILPKMEDVVDGNKDTKQREGIQNNISIT